MKMLGDYRRQAAQMIAEDLPRLREHALITAGGVANSSASSAAMSSLLMNVLNEQPSEGVLFLPMVERGSIPVRMLSVQIENHTLTIMAQTMTGPQRAELLKRIREQSH
jgi:hypothetical protein